jgi:hypothetical protein
MTISIPPPLPTSSQAPVLLQHLLALQNNLDFNNTFDSAVFAVATCAFWGVCHLGEITVPSISSFDLAVTCTGSLLSFPPNSLTPHSITFHIPWSKTTRSAGADISITALLNLSCPVVALHHHLLSNSDLLPSAHLFTFKTPDGLHHMVKKAFTDCCSSIFLSADLPVVHGHSFRIGGATEHLHQGLSVDS